MSEQFKTVKSALDYIEPFTKWKDYSSAFEKYIDENLETYKNQHAEEYEKIKDDVIKYLTEKGITWKKGEYSDHTSWYYHINHEVFSSLVELANVTKYISGLERLDEINEERFDVNISWIYDHAIPNIIKGLKEKKFIPDENKESIKNNADKIVRQLKCFKLKFKDEFDAKYKKGKDIEKITEPHVNIDKRKLSFWYMIEANDFIEYLDDYIKSENKKNHLLKKLFSFDYFYEDAIRQKNLLNRVYKDDKFQKRQKEDQIKFFEHIGDFFDGALANDAKKILQEKCGIKLEVIENKGNELLKEKDSNHKAKNENVPSRKKFWIGILLLTVIIIALGVFKTWVFAFLIVPIVFSIILLCKKPNKNEYRNLKIENSYPITEGNDMDPNLLKDEYFADLKLKEAKNILNTK